MCRGWTQTDYQNKHCNINQKDEGTLDDRGRDGGANFILRIKQQETCLTLQEHDDNDYVVLFSKLSLSCFVKQMSAEVNMIKEPSVSLQVTKFFTS